MAAFPFSDCTLELTGWVHAKKVIVEPDGLLSAKLLAERICAHFGCSYEPPLSIVEEVA